MSVDYTTQFCRPRIERITMSLDFTESDMQSNKSFKTVYLKIPHSICYRYSMSVVDNSFVRKPIQKRPVSRVTARLVGEKYLFDRNGFFAFVRILRVCVHNPRMKNTRSYDLV